MHQCSVEAPFKSTAIDIAGLLLKSMRGNSYFLIAVVYFTKWLEFYAIPNQIRFPATKAIISTHDSLRRCYGASESARLRPPLCTTNQTNWWNDIVACLLKARTEKPAESAITMEWFCRNARC
jgi:hypothetical protein